MRVEAAELLHSVSSDKPLGARRAGGGTEFSIFAPRARAAYVRHWRAGENDSLLLEASTSDGAVWTARSTEDLDGRRYVWHIDGDNALPGAAFNVRAPIVDPYANAFEKSSGAGIVKYYDSIPRARDGFEPPRWHDLSILEIHVRDVLARAKADISPDERLTFSGLAKWLKSPDCYLRKLGVNWRRAPARAGVHRRKPHGLRMGLHARGLVRARELLRLRPVGRDAEFGARRAGRNFPPRRNRRALRRRVQPLRRSELPFPHRRRLLFRDLLRRRAHEFQRLRQRLPREVAYGSAPDKGQPPRNGRKVRRGPGSGSTSPSSSDSARCAKSSLS